MKSILWVEDDRDQFIILSYSLKNDYEIKIAKDYNNALDKINKEHFDLFIIDIIIPSGQKHMSINDIINIREKYYGLELINKIREKDKKTPIIVVSVVSDKDLKEKIMKIDDKIPFLWKYLTDSNEIKSEADKILKS